MNQNIKSKQKGVVFRYLVSGTIAAIVHFGLLIVLIEFLTINPTLASALGFTAAVFINYSLQFHWTFAIESKGMHQVIFTRYLLVTLFTLSLNTVLFWTMNEFVGFQYLYSQIFVTGIVLIVNFLVNNKYTFNQNRFDCRYESL